MTSSTHQLAAILFTDIVGYTSMMGKDEARAMKLLDKNRLLQQDLVKKYNGKWHKDLGDGSLISFQSAINAIKCAVEIQRSLNDQELSLRIGIHLGDVTFKETDVFGDGVNIASRLQSIADPGGIYISDSVHKAIRGKSEIQSTYMGELDLKNVDYPVKTYAIRGEGLPIPQRTNEKKLSGRFWAEVRRRNVHRAVLAYLAFAFIVISLKPIIPQLDTFTQLLFGGLSIGLVISIFLAWNYERSPQGFVKVTSRKSWENPFSDTQKKPFTSNTIILVLLTAIIGINITQNFLNTDTTLSQGSFQKSIVVLPFENMSGDPDQEYFSDGISEEIINALVKFPELKVAGRTSAFSYKGRNEDLRKIGEDLGVATILEGSVRKSGNQLRITAQLINAQDGFHMWSETYSRELTDVFAVQDEITEAIIGELKVQLFGSQKILSAKPTMDLEAYNIYLQARHKLMLRGDKNLVEARDLFMNAILLDSLYAPAYSGLSKVNALLPVYSAKVSSLETSKLAKKAANKALDLDPSNAEAQMALGIVNLYSDWNWDEARKRLELAHNLAPNDAEMTNFLGDYYQVVRDPKALETELRAMELDPLHSVKHIDVSIAYFSIGDYENALYYVNNSLSMDPTLWVHTLLVIEIYLKMNELDNAKQALVEYQNNNPKDSLFQLYFKTKIEIASGSVDQTINLVTLTDKLNQKLLAPVLLAELLVDLKMYDEAAYWLNKSSQEHDNLFIIRLRNINPEELQNQPVLQKALDTPELNKLWEIRRKNLEKM